jgi:CRISPR-associated endonuclease/helicase Cas3
LAKNSNGPFGDWFARFASDSAEQPLTPREWQQELAKDDAPRSRVIRIPTGYGKTLGVLAAWLYHRVERADERWPRRLIWTLPMRVLVEQTADEVRKCLERLGLLWKPGTEHQGKVGVHLLMGGVDQGGEWNLYPEADAILIATQDMALSRAMNRGYAAPRARWPMEFGLLNQDALWVLDEVQLMDVGLATSAQLQSFLDDDAGAGRSLRPRLSWWMSATLQSAWLKTIDTAERHPAWIMDPTMLTPSALDAGLATIEKALEVREVAANDPQSFAKLVAEVHAKARTDGEHGRITLVVCNTVDRASLTYDALRKDEAVDDLRLVHGRFRPHERAAWKAEFLGRSACKPGVDRIIVATQVVEAGVDISATTLVTELAPWSSLVQRFGRCARYGGSGSVVVVDRGRDEKTAPPYACEELEAAKWAIGKLLAAAPDVGIATIENFEQSLNAEQRHQLYPYRPRSLLLRRDLDELFDTTPDLTGADIDVSPFIRSGDERDVSVFWLNVPVARKGEPAPHPPENRKPSRDELCNVPFLAARDWLCGKATKEKPARRLLASRRAWTWDWLDGQWKVAERASLVPGAVVCVAADSGGYRDERGFDADSKTHVTVLKGLPPAAQDTADDLEDNEELSDAAHYRTIATHNAEVGQLAKRVALGILPSRLAELLVLAGRGHDQGKVPTSFQAIIHVGGPHHARFDLAKAPEGCWQKPCVYRSSDGERRGFRHELASCLALFAVVRRYEPSHQALLGPWGESLTLLGEKETPLPLADKNLATDLEQQVLACSAPEFDLLAYLVLSHHGKVRVALHAGPKDQEYVTRDERGLPIRGVREGDELPALPLGGTSSLPLLTLTLAPANLGLSAETGRSWRDRTGALLRHHGPAALAYLEALLIAADRRASKLTTPDPLLGVAALGGTT